MGIRLHDLTGEHTALSRVEKVADNTTWRGIVFVAPFKCTVKEVNVISGEAWVGVGSQQDYNRLILYDEDGSAAGTISGSVSGTPVPARTVTALYSTERNLAKDETLEVQIGTVNAGATAPPTFAVQTVFVGR